MICVVISYLLRFEFNIELASMYASSAYWMLGICLILKPVIYIRFGLYRHLWAYASVDELRLIVLAVAAASGSVTLLMMLLSRKKGAAILLRIFGFCVVFGGIIAALMIIGNRYVSFAVLSAALIVLVIIQYIRVRKLSMENMAAVKSV